jgi:V8-like Glu-specific endopeptidase
VYGYLTTGVKLYFYLDLIDDTNWPKNLKAFFNQDILSGDPRHDAREIIHFSERKGINPEDKRFTTLGGLLQALLEQPLGLEDIQSVTALIVAYDLYLDDTLRVRLRETYKIPVYAGSIEASETDVGPEIDWLGPTDIELESWLVPEPDLLDVGFLVKAIKAASSVCKIELSFNGSSLTRSQGTGVLIFPKLLLTNFHVLQPEGSDTNIQNNAKNITLQFSVFSGSDGFDSKAKIFKLDPQDPVLAVSPPEQLDFALLKIEDSILDDEEIKPICWKSDFTLKPHESINILQHPEGFPMQLAISKDGITNILDNKGWLQYVSNTSFGSSGSPCFNNDWELVALHHAQRRRGIHSIREGILFSAIYDQIRGYLN